MGTGGPVAGGRGWVGERRIKQLSVKAVINVYLMQKWQEYICMVATSKISFADEKAPTLLRKRTKTWPLTISTPCLTYIDAA
jgi:hypothetical protein